MKVFVTGGTGFVGSSVVDLLLREGHDVLALARSDASAEQLASKGVTVVRGDLTTPEVLTKAAAEADGVIHTAFVHDFGNFQRCCDIEIAACEAMFKALEGTNKPLVATSGQFVVWETGKEIVDESKTCKTCPFSTRIGCEEYVTQAAQRGIRTSVLRLSHVHNEKKGGSAFSRIQENMFKSHGYAFYQDDGSNEQASTHVDDVARAYLLALQRSHAGAVYNIAAQLHITAHSIAHTLARKLGLTTVKSVSSDEAQQLMGPLAACFALNCLMDSSKARAELGWEPQHTDDFLQAIATHSSEDVVFVERSTVQEAEAAA